MKSHDRGDIVKEAKSRVNLVWAYNLLQSNCEHFATIMRYGKSESRQVDDAKLIATLLFASFTVIALVFISIRKK